MLKNFLAFALLFVGNLAFSQASLFRARTEQQIAKVISQLQSPEMSVRQDTLEIIRGSDYLLDDRVKHAVLDLIGGESSKVAYLAIEVIQELPGDPLPQLSYVFSKTVQEERNGGWRSSWGPKFIMKYAGNNISLFRHFEQMMIPILSVEYPGIATLRWVQIAELFRDLGTQGSISADFPVLRQLLAALPEGADEILKAHFGSFTSIAQDEQVKLIGLFFAEELKDWNDAVLAGRTLEWMPQISPESLELLATGLVAASKVSQERALHVIRKNLKPGNAEHARLVEKILQQSGAVPGVNVWVVEATVANGYISDMANPNAVIKSALDSFATSSDHRNAINLLARNSKYFQLNDFSRLVALLPDDRFTRDFAESMTKGDLNFLTALVNNLNGLDKKAQINAVMVIDAGAEFSKIDFFAEEGRARSFYNFFKSCSKSYAGEVKSVCARKVSEFDDFIQANVKKLPLKFVFDYLEPDLRPAIQDPALVQNKDRHVSFKVIDTLRTQVEPNLQWSREEFDKIWIPFFVEQIRAGNATEIRNTARFLRNFRFTVDGQPFLQMVPGDGVTGILLNRFLEGDTPTARLAGLELIGIAYEYQNSAGRELAKTLAGLLNDSRKYVVITVLNNMFYLQPMDAATLARMLELTKSSDVELRGTSLNQFAELFKLGKLGRDVFDSVIPDLKKALVGSNLQERALVTSVAAVPRRYPEMREILFPTSFLIQLIADFQAERERFLRDDEDAAKYYYSFVLDFFNISYDLVASKDVPVEFMLEMLDSQSKLVQEGTIRGLSSLQREWCQKLPQKRCGVLHVGSQSGSIMISKKVLDRFAEFAMKNPASQNVPIIDYMININQANEGRPPFSILEYAVGKQTIAWD